MDTDAQPYRIGMLFQPSSKRDPGGGRYNEKNYTKEPPVPRIRWSPAPPEVGPVQRKNFINVQIDAVGVGLASAASPFLP